MEFGDLITRMAQAISQGDGEGAADCFCQDGVYHDVFYGAFPKPEIPRMVTEYFHRDATNFIWDMHDPISNGKLGYARYVFSYEGRMEGTEGKRALFEGVSVCELKDGLILSYHEVANTSTGLQMLGFPAERLGLFTDNLVQTLAARDESQHHVRAG